MDKHHRRRIGIIADACVIVLAILASIVAVKRLMEPRPSSAPASPALRSELPRPRVGTKINHSEVEWSDRDQTLLLILSSTCHFCSESAPFYRRLLDQLRGDGKWAVVAIFPQPTDEGRRYLATMGLRVDRVLQAPLSSLGTGGTPTLVAVDSRGVVTGSWLGRLSAAAELEVIAQLRSPTKKEKP